MRARIESVHQRLAPFVGRLVSIITTGRGTRRDLIEVADALEAAARELRAITREF